MILLVKALDKWLAAEQLADAMYGLMKPLSAKRMAEHAVSARIHSTKMEGPELLVC